MDMITARQEFMKIFKLRVASDPWDKYFQEEMQQVKSMTVNKHITNDKVGDLVFNRFCDWYDNRQDDLKFYLDKFKPGTSLPEILHHLISFLRPAKIYIMTMPNAQY